MWKKPKRGSGAKQEVEIFHNPSTDCKLHIGAIGAKSEFLISEKYHKILLRNKRIFMKKYAREIMNFGFKLLDY